MTAGTRVARQAGRASDALAWLTDRLCALLLVLLVLDVWLGVFARYVLPLPITFTEELARYLMIWVALLAVSSGIARREHIGVLLLLERFPMSFRRWVLLLVDVLALAFFATLLWFGIGMVERGAKSFTMIFGVSKALPFAAVPVAAALACVQLALVALRDQLGPPWTEDAGTAP